jgi:dsRNA-specific ribonuclease
MSVIRVGSNGRYADGWSNVFGKAKASSTKKAAKKAAKKAVKKASKKKVSTAKKKAKR